MGNVSRHDLSNTSQVSTEPATAEADNDNRSRLSRAIDGLSEAYAEQVRAVKEYQKQNTELAAAVARLDESCHQYQQIAAKLTIAPLRRKALRLGRLARQSELAEA
jgi:hypothetical protein